MADRRQLGDQSGSACTACLGYGARVGCPECGRFKDASVRVLPPKSAAELEQELQSAHAMIGRLMLLILERTEMNADDVLAAIREADDA